MSRKLLPFSFAGCFLTAPHLNPRCFSVDGQRARLQGDDDSECNAEKQVAFIFRVFKMFNTLVCFVGIFSYDPEKTD